MVGGRPGRWAALLVGLMTSTGAADMPQTALHAIDSCLLKLNPDVDVGYDRIVARCPGLARRLEESGWSAWLPRDWQRSGNDLSAGGLREFREIVSRELTLADTRARGHAPSVEGVPDVLASLARTDDERSGWWARTKAWLRNVFERPEPAADEGWLVRMVGQSGLSQAVIELVSYVALALVALLAVVIVVNELRIGRVFGGLRRRFALLADTPVTRQGDGQGDRISWADVQRAPPLERPGLLLELLVARLIEGGRLRSARGLTVRELTRTAQLSDERDLGRLAELARTSERVRFSNVEVSDGDIAAAVEGGRLLLEQIAPGVQGGGVRGGDAKGGGQGGGR
jgi:hypothetical protein